MTSTARVPELEIIDVEVTLRGRDEIRLHLEVAGGVIVYGRLHGIGCPELLSLFVKWRPLLTGPLDKVPLPEGSGHADILLREAILKAQGLWNFPYMEEELCHCRGVSTEIVDRAIIGGCHSSFAVAKQTSAGTSCGNCRVDTEQIIAYRLGRAK